MSQRTVEQGVGKLLVEVRWGWFPVKTHIACERGSNANLLVDHDRTAAVPLDACAHAAGCSCLLAGCPQRAPTPPLRWVQTVMLITLWLKQVQMMRPIRVFLIVALIVLGIGCARLSGQTPMAFWGGSMGQASNRSPWPDAPATGSIGGGGTVGVAGGLFLDEFEKRWAHK